MGEKTCETCRWWNIDDLGDGYCVNSDSDHCTERREAHHACGAHTPAIKGAPPMTKPDITMYKLQQGLKGAANNHEDTHEGEFWMTSGMAKSAISHLLTTANITEAQLIELVNGRACVVPVDRGYPEKGLREPVRSFDDTHSAYEVIEQEFFSEAALKARP